MTARHGERVYACRVDPFTPSSRWPNRAGFLHPCFLVNASTTPNNTHLLKPTPTQTRKYPHHNPPHNMTNWETTLNNATQRTKQNQPPFTREHIQAAREWPTCVCGEQDDQIPRDEEGRPLDLVLYGLGRMFYNAVEQANVKLARKAFKLIERRAEEVIEDGPYTPESMMTSPMHRISPDDRAYLNKWFQTHYPPIRPAFGGGDECPKP